MSRVSHPIDTLYPYQPASESGPWTLYRDGIEIMHGTEQECWNWIHYHTACSVSHALLYEGYAIKPGSVNR